MALLHSTMVPLGTAASDFSLLGIDGKTYTLANFAEKKGLVIIFMCNHCPYVQACEKRLIALQTEFGPKGIQCVGINANDSMKYPDDSFEEMKKRAVAIGHNFPYLWDETQTIAKQYGAVCTPDIFVYNEERKLVYRGRIDDNWQEPEKVTKHELHDAIQCLIDEKPLPIQQNPSMGCSIKWK